MYSKDMLPRSFPPPPSPPPSRPLPDNYGGTALSAADELLAPAAADIPPCGRADAPSSPTSCDCSHCTNSPCGEHRPERPPLPPPPANAGGVPRGLLSSLLPPSIGSLSSHGDFGFEELLLVGLIFLLSQSDGGHDILVLLALLLFFK